mmetsp:Transcript_127672/g.310388  ORF Transcript_127672/g.310388 Transcript_127672/m.310388 type:complete len:274 (-) Transcript_127672:9-830(-)
MVVVGATLFRASTRLHDAISRTAHRVLVQTADDIAHKPLERQADILVVEALRGFHAGDQRDAWVGHPLQELDLHGLVHRQQAGVEGRDLEVGPPGLAAPLQLLEQRARALEARRLHCGALVVEGPADVRGEGVQPGGDVLVGGLGLGAVLELDDELRTVVTRLGLGRDVLVDVEEVLGGLAVVVGAHHRGARVLHPLDVEPVGGLVRELDVKLLAVVDGPRAGNLHAASGAKHAPQWHGSCHGAPVDEGAHNHGQAAPEVRKQRQASSGRPSR